MHNPTAPTPVSVPPSPERLKPVAVEPPKKPASKAWIWLLVLGIGGGLAYWLFQRHLAEDTLAQKRVAAATRTAKVTAGKLRETIRLSGQTGPERFVSILGPQLRGSRSFSGGGGAFMGRSRGGGSSSGGSSSGGSSGGSSSGGSSSSASASSSGSGSSSSSGSLSISSTSSAMSAGGGGGSTNPSMGGGSSVGGVRSSSNAMRSATSRERSSSGGSGRSASSGGGSAAASSAMGGEGLGSTSSSLFGGGGSSGGGGGGGGGSTEFGSVLQDLIPAGAMAKKGQKIAEFDRQYMLQRLDDYKAGVEQQELNLVRQKASIEESRKAHEQSVAVAKAAVEKAKLDLKTVPVRSPMDAERFKLALEEAEARYKQVLAEVPHVRAGEQAQLKISELDLQQSKLEERRAEANADRMVMKAPIAGMAVMMRMFRGGEFGQSQVGDPVPAGYPFMQIVDTSSMIVNALVNQVDVERLRVGQKASVRFDAFPDLTLPGRVYSIAAMPRNSFSARASFLKEIPVTIKLEAMDPRVIPDLSVSADVLVGEEDAEAIAPLSAVFQEANGKPYAFVQTPKGWERREVQLGRSSFTSVAIRSGLKAGEIVAEDKPNMGPAAPQKSALFVRRQPPRG